MNDRRRGILSADSQPWWHAGWSIALALVLAFSLAASGCFFKKKADTADTGDEDAADAGTGEPLPPPTATVDINYSRPNDSLERATVTKYFGADVIGNAQSKSGRSASLIRFDGGVPVWEFRADRSLAGRITDIGSSGWEIKQLEYGKVPAHFSQLLPDEGPPEPLDRGSFYVITIERSSGVQSFQAVKVLADGSLQAFAAQPRAGSSYVVCCNLPPDFSQPVILPEEVVPDDTTGQDNSANPDSGSPDSGNQDSGNQGSGGGPQP
ncbi:MAG: hypothetical protein ACLQAT_22770 [Candidatus Binataceae bacterium]